MVKTVGFGLGGGMDLVTPAIALPPGRVIASMNYEPVSSGYRRLRGFERFDGRTAPSATPTYRINYDGGGGAETVEQVLAGATVAGGTYELMVLAPSVLLSGSWGTTGATAYMLVHIEAGDPDAIDNTTLLENLTTIGVANGAAVIEVGSNLAADFRRNHMSQPDGEGPVRGVFFDGEQLLAVRDEVGGATASISYSSVSGGWQATNTALRLDFTSGGTHEIAPGEFLTGATSGASVAVQAVVLTSGTWAGGDAAGFLMVYEASGTLVAENLNLTSPGSAANVATISGPPGAATTLPAGGTYKFIQHNFYGAANLRRVYGVSSVSPAFQWHEGVISFISTGMESDLPNDIAAYRNQLLLGFPGGSLQNSSPGNPFEWDAVTGASEIGIGDEITAIKPISGALVIFGENSIHALYGNDSSDFTLEAINLEAGALAGTVQAFGDIVYMDNRGIRKLSASRAYGNFTAGTVSRLVSKLIEDYRRDGVSPTASLVSRTADQYWVFFDNGTSLIVYLGGRDPVILPVKLGLDVTCAISVEDDGEERMFVGTADGWVMELNKGNSFDGDEIEHYVRLPFNHFGEPQLEKQVQKVVIDVEVASTATIEVSAEYDNGSVPGSTPITAALTSGGGAIDDLGSNESYFASQIEAQAEAYLDSLCKNVSLKIGGLSDNEEPHTLTGVTYFITPMEEIEP